MYELIRDVNDVKFLITEVEDIPDSLRFIEKRYINPIKHLDNITIDKFSIDAQDNKDKYPHGIYSIINKNIITLYNIYSIKNVGHLYKIDSVGSSVIDSYTHISKTIEEFDKYELILKNDDDKDVDESEESEESEDEESEEEGRDYRMRRMKRLVTGQKEDDKDNEDYDYRMRRRMSAIIE